MSVTKPIIIIGYLFKNTYNTTNSIDYPFKSTYN